MDLLAEKTDFNKKIGIKNNHEYNPELKHPRIALFGLYNMHLVALCLAHCKRKQIKLIDLFIKNEGSKLKLNVTFIRCIILLQVFIRDFVIQPLFKTENSFTMLYLMLNPSMINQSLSQLKLEELKFERALNETHDELEKDWLEKLVQVGNDLGKSQFNKINLFKRSLAKELDSEGYFKNLKDTKELDKLLELANYKI